MSDSLPTIRFLSPRNLMCLCMGGGLALGVMLRNPALLFLGATAFFVLVRSAWQASRHLVDVSVERRHQPRAFEGHAVQVDLGVSTESARPHSLLLVEDSFPPGSYSRIQHLITEPFDRRERLSLRYFGVCQHHRGLYTLGPVRLSAADDLGLMSRRVIVEVFTHLLVYPQAVDLQIAEVLGDGTLAHVGVETTPRPGESEEFSGLREYRFGDSPNKIHWRSTARNGQLMVKEFQEEMMTEVSFFLDLGRMGLTGLGDQTSVEYAIKSAASLAKRAVEKCHAVQLFAIGRSVEHIPPGSGTTHLLLLLDRLALLKAEGEVAFCPVVEAYVPFLRPGGTAVLILSATTIDIDTMSPVLAALRSRSILPLVVLVDDRAFLKIFREQERRHTEAMRLEEIVQYLILEGARVHIVTRAPSPDQALLQGLERGWSADV